MKVSKVLVGLLLSMSISVSVYADEVDGKYDDCIAVGDMAVSFMTMMQSGMSLPKALREIKDGYTSDDGDDAGQKWANQMMTQMYQTNSMVLGKKDKKEKIAQYEKDQVRQCMFVVDRREKEEAYNNQPKQSI